MPRKLSPQEIQNQKDFMYQKGISLIKEKGVMNLTLDEITDAAQMAKGSFYHYYKSKEQYLYDVIKRNEMYYFNLMLEEGNKKNKTKEDIIHVFDKSFLDDNCLFAYLVPEDQNYLLRRLPDQISEQELHKSQQNYQSISELMGLKVSEDNYGTLSYLMDGLQAILRSPANYGDVGRKKAAHVVVNAIADFFMEEQK